jgi:hypothetical protein
MKKNIIQTITNILNENEDLISTTTTQTYVLTPDEGYILKNVKTGVVVTTKICISQKSKLADYIELPITEGL